MNIFIKIVFAIVYFLGGIIIGYDAGCSSSFPGDVTNLTPEQNRMMTNLVLLKSCGGVVGSLIFCFTRKYKKQQFMIADFGVLAGSLLYSLSDGGEIQALSLPGRFLSGCGSLLLLLSSPILASSIWSGTTMLASIGITYQVGAFVAQNNSMPYSEIAIWMPVIIQLFLVTFTKKALFDNQGNATFRDMREKKLRPAILSSLIIDLSPYFVGMKFLVNLGPKTSPNFPTFSTAVAFFGSIFCMFLVRTFSLKKLAIFSVCLISLELCALAVANIFFQQNQDFKTLILYIYTFTISSTLSTIPLIFIIKSFPPTHRGMGLGFVITTVQCFGLIINIILDLIGTTDLHVKEEWIVTSYIVLSLAFLMVVIKFVQDIKTAGDGGHGPDPERNVLQTEGNENKSLKGRSIPPLVQEGNSLPMQYSLESYDQQPVCPPERYPIPDTGMHDTGGSSLTFSYTILSVEEKKECLVVTRNSLELFSRILNTETEPKPLKEDHTISMLENCKQSQPVIKAIIESTTDDEELLFEALYLRDELEQVISKYEKLEAAQEPGGKLPENSEASKSELEAAQSLGGNLPEKAHASEAITESTTADDEEMLFEPFYLRDELEQVISKYEQLEATQKFGEHHHENSDPVNREDMEAAQEPGGKLPENSDASKSELEAAQSLGGNLPEKAHASEANSPALVGAHSENKLVDFPKGESAEPSNEKINDK